jgi:hypothetical protein
MLEVLKTRAKNETYNVGYKEQIELYDQVAVCPDYYIAVAETMCNVDKAHGIMEDPQNDGSMAETWAVMDHLIERRNDWICTEHPEYKTIPKRSECILQEQRTTRSSKGSPIAAISPSAKDSQVAICAPLSPKDIQKASPLPKDAQLAHQRIARGVSRGSLSPSSRPTGTPPALRPASARRTSSSSTFSTIEVASAKVHKTRGFSKK